MREKFIKLLGEKSLQPWVRQIFLGAQNPSYKRKKIDKLILIKIKNLIFKSPY